MKKNAHGEGNYEATRDYTSRTTKFVESSRVDAAAMELLPRLVAQREHSARQSAPQLAPDSIESDGPLEDGARIRGSAGVQAPSPPLPAGFNPYFDLPPV